MNNRYILTIFSIIIILFSCSNNEKSGKSSTPDSNSIAQNNSKKPFIPYRQDYVVNYWDENIKELEFSQENLTELANIKNQPPVIVLRKAFNDFLAGKYQTNNLDLSAVGDSITIRDNNGLKAFAKQYYEGKFLALNFNEQPDGTLEILIMPNLKPDIIFIAQLKVSRVNDTETFQLVNFYKTHHLPDEIHVIRNQSRRLLKDDKFLF